MIVSSESMQQLIRFTNRTIKRLRRTLIYSLSFYDKLNIIGLAIWMDEQKHD